MSMKNFNLTVLIFSALAAVACSVGPVTPPTEPGGTHKVKFTGVADAGTRTSLVEGEDVATFYWSEDDGDRLVVTENGIEPVDMVVDFSRDYRTATILAEFANTSATSFDYAAFLGSEIPSGQESTPYSYDPAADVLVSDTITRTSVESVKELVFNFRRTAAVSKITLTGLQKGEAVKEIILSSDSDFINGRALTLTCDGEADGEGKAAFFFVTKPVSGAAFSIKVKTSLQTYEKDFSSPVTLYAEYVNRLNNVNLANAWKNPDPNAGKTGWFLVKNTDFLSSGDVIRIACRQQNAVAGPKGSERYLSKKSAVFTEDGTQLTNAPEANDITIVSSGTKWELRTSEGVLSTSSSKNLNVDKPDDTLTAWPISIDQSSGNATIGVPSSVGRILYNSSAPRFVNYTSSTVVSTSMLLPQIYKYYDGGGHDTPTSKLQMSPISWSSNLNSITFTWTAVSGAASYGLVFDGGEEFETLNTSYVATGLKEGSSHVLKVRAKSGVSDKADSDYSSCTGTTTSTSPVTSTKYPWYEMPLINDDNNDGICDYDKTLYYALHYCDGPEKAPGGGRARNYTVCFSSEYHCPVWVAAPRHSMYVGGSGRNDSYKADPSFSSSIQYKSKDTGGGCNKGHMLGSAERTSSVATNRQVFYYSNIAPQLSAGFNTGGGGWNLLEDWVDGKVCADTLYEVIGCYFKTFTDGYGNTVSPKTISFGGRSDVAFPTMFYYVLLRTKNGNTGKPLWKCTSEELQCAAFVRSHTNSLKGQKPSSREMMSVADLEKITGFTYFTNVPQAPKTTFKASDWGL